MTRAPSPRTAFSGPTHIPFDQTIHRMWGDSESGKIPDWIYVSGENIHQMIFKLAPGQAFRHSENYRTYFAADVVYAILKGSIVMMNPETGEAQRAEKLAQFEKSLLKHRVVCFGSRSLGISSFASRTSDYACWRWPARSP